MDTFHLADREPVARAIEAAAKCDTLDELYAAIEAYKGHDVAAREPYTPAWPIKKPVAHPDGPLMIVSEKPEPGDLGADRPFTGRAYGSTMGEALVKCGVDVDQIHTTFACHWAPGDEKSPNSTQLSASRPFLFREIEIVKPRAIMVQGRAVLESMLFYRDPITPWLGMTMGWKRGDLRIPLYITWHPAFATRFKTQMGDFTEQVRGFFDQFGMPDGGKVKQRPTYRMAA